jgi:hypothetical protein
VDCFSLRVPEPAPTVDEALIRALCDLPAWVGVMLKSRNRIVGLFGLRTDGGAPAAHSDLPLGPGGFVRFFPVTARESDGQHDEILMEVDDTHLSFCLSALRATDVDGEQRFALTTIVELHNVWGRLYFAPVRPFHRLMMRTLMRRVANGLAANSSPGPA